MNYVLTQKNLFDCIHRRANFERAAIEFMEDEVNTEGLRHSEFLKDLLKLLKLEVATNVR